MNLKPWPALALSAVVLAACASDDEEYGRHGATYVAPPTLSSDVFLLLPYDSDHDHRITKPEQAAAIAGAWRDLSKDRAEVHLLELQDWVTKVEGEAAAPFNPLEYAPEGGDSVTRDQFTTALSRRFARLDRNGDGVIDPSEFLTIRPAVRGSNGEGGQQPQGGSRHRRRG